MPCTSFLSILYSPIRPDCLRHICNNRRESRIFSRKLRNVSRPCAIEPPTPLMDTSGPPVRTYAPNTEWDPEVQAYLEACLGVDMLRRISEALTRPPLATCIRTNTLRTSPKELLEALPAALSPEDRALWESNPAKPFIHPLLPEAIIVPGTGPHQIDYACTGGKEVVVGRLAGEAMMRGAHLFVPGMLAVSAGVARGDLVAVSVGVEVSGTEETKKKWGMTKGTVLGQDPERDAQLPDRSRLYIGVGRAELSRVELFRHTSGLAVSMQERVFRTPGCGDVLRGQLMLQNLPSLVAAHVLGPQPGERILDMCAAPGGKTTAIAQLMRDQGEVVALDRTHGKAREVRLLAEELGLSCVKAYKMDASKAVLGHQRSAQREGQQAQRAQYTGVGGEQQEGGPSGGGAEREAGGEAAGAVVSEKMRRRVERIRAARLKRGQDPGVFAQLPEGKEEVVEGFERESFDRVLLDAPCSALGLRPRLVHRQTLRELQGTAAYQRKLMEAAVQLVKPGGTLVFSTCTINPGENEANVRHLLDSFTFMELVPQTPHLGGPGMSGDVALPGGAMLRLLSPEQAALVQRFDPAAALDTVGFFISKFVKTRSCCLDDQR